jgi:hypothetical protein
MEDAQARANLILALTSKHKPTTQVDSTAVAPQGNNTDTSNSLTLDYLSLGIAPCPTVCR